jgi:S-formylglutathione hydrolase FrmB
MRKAIHLFALILVLATVDAADVKEITFKSQCLAKDKKITVVLPDAYAAKADKRFPTAYFLDGFAGSHSRWPQSTPMKELVDKYGIIVVCPDGTRDSWYWDSPIVPTNKYETFIYKDVVTYVDANYRTVASAKGRAITGLSMGGHGAMFVGLRHPDVFGTVAAMSGGLDVRPFPKKWNMKKWLGEKEAHKENWETHTVINVLDKVKPGQKILFDCGTKDFFIKVNRATHEKMKKLNIPHTYEEYPGGHSWGYWKVAVVRHMAFFNESFGGEKYEPKNKVD